ncbi:MAG: helix-turn-helix transcriptional regulator [Rhizobiaceae bacterium]|nr:helix-turn-helix transcriptional regulator [Rhizobiaceae bacterium]
MRKPTSAGVDIGKTLRNRRMALGLDFREVARQIGVSHQQLLKYERGLSRLTSGSFRKPAACSACPSRYCSAVPVFSEGPTARVRRRSWHSAPLYRRKKGKSSIMPFIASAKARSAGFTLLSSAPWPGSRLNAPHYGCRRTSVLRENSDTLSLSLT